MRHVKKLTPALIKKIISEEKAKLNKEIQIMKLKENKSLLAKLKLLKKIKSKKGNTLQENKKLKIKFSSTFNCFFSIILIYYFK